jgi:hypothetical protein
MIDQRGLAVAAFGGDGMHHPAFGEHRVEARLELSQLRFPPDERKGAA